MWVLFLVLGAVVPLLLFAGAALYQISRDAHVARDQGLTNTARALALAMDGEVRSWKAALAALTESRSLRPDRMAEFYDEARQFAGTHDGWIVLTDPSGQQLLNTLRPYGSPLPGTSAPETLQAILQDRKPVVTDLIFGKVAQRHIVAVAMPVVRDGTVRYMLDLSFGPERLSRLLEQQKVPPSWVIGLNDRQNKVVARSVGAEQRVGKLAPAWINTASARADAGLAEGLFSDGRPARAAFQRLHEVPWVLVLAVPAAELPWARTFVIFLLIGVGVIVIAAGAALYSGRRIARPVSRLAQASEPMLRGETVDLGDPPAIREVRALQQALVRSAESVRASEENLRRLNADLEARVRERTGALIDANAALHTSEKRFRLAADAANTLVYEMNSAGEMYFEYGLTRLLGYDADEIPRPTYAWWLSQVHPDDRPPIGENLATFLAPEREFSGEYRVRHKQGHYLAVHFTGKCVSGASGQHLRVVGAIRDMTELKQAEDALRLLNLDLEQRVATRTAELSRAIETLGRQANQLRALAAELNLAEQRERRRLAGVLHDELQQLLVATRLRAHMLGRTEDPQVREGAEEIVELIEKALADTRSLTGELSPPTLQKGGLLPALEWLTRWMGERHRFTVRLERPAAPLPALPEDLFVLLYQSVRELLFNAVKHAKVSAAEVTVAAAANTLTLTITDAGIGFDPTLLRVAGGTEGGFGLLGIRERLEWVGGRLEIASTPGQGSRMTLVVPLGPAPAEDTRDWTPPASRIVAGREASSAHPIRVLVVDDHALVRQGFAKLLAGEPDLEVVGEADNGQAAIELTRRLTPDVILMDVSMPIMNGIEATRRIHAEFPAVRVIGLSMLEDAEQPHAMREAGTAAYLRKSDSTEALLAAIRGGGAPPP
jgi:PAS domain S-box-containing protein